MRRRGVCYDVGRVMWGQNWRPEFSLEEARRELQIIRDDLHCNAVRHCASLGFRLGGRRSRYVFLRFEPRNSAVKP
jgi:hypothetical protein